MCKILRKENNFFTYAKRYCVIYRQIRQTINIVYKLYTKTFLMQGCLCVDVRISKKSIQNIILLYFYSSLYL